MTEQEYINTLDYAFVIKAKDLTPQDLIKRRLYQINCYYNTIVMCNRRRGICSYYYNMIERIEKEIKEIKQKAFA